MRFTSIFLAAGFAAFVNAQSTTSGGNAPSTTQNSADAAASSAQAAVVRCLENCKDGDVDCQAHCITVPSPNEQQVNATNTCVAACPQGNGSEADTEAYRDCVGRCIGNHYYTSSAGTPAPTGSAGSGGNGNSNGNGNGNGNDDDNDNNGGDSDSNNGGSGTSGNGASRTTSGSQATETGGAALLGASSGVIGALGFMAAVMAL